MQFTLNVEGHRREVKTNGSPILRTYDNTRFNVVILSRKNLISHVKESFYL